jgi:hypothetical protein
LFLLRPFTVNVRGEPPIFFGRAAVCRDENQTDPLHVARVTIIFVFGSPDQSIWNRTSPYFPPNVAFRFAYRHGLAILLSQDLGFIG